MVDAVGGSAIATQLQSATTVNVVALKNEREQTEAVVRNIDRSVETVRADAAPPHDRGRNLDIKA